MTERISCTYRSKSNCSYRKNCFLSREADRFAQARSRSTGRATVHLDPAEPHNPCFRPECATTDTRCGCVSVKSRTTVPVVFRLRRICRRQKASGTLALLCNKYRTSPALGMIPVVKNSLCGNRLLHLRIKAGVKNIFFVSTLSPEDRQDAYPTFSPLRLCGSP